MGRFQIRHQPMLVLLCTVEEANSDATVHTWIRIYASTLGISRILHPHVSKSLYFRVSILTGRRAAWVPDSDTGGWQESLIFQHSRTYYSLKRQKGRHSYSYLTEEETGAGSAASQMANNKIKTAQAVMPGDSGKTPGKRALAWGYFPWPTWWCGLWNCFCYSHRNLFHGLTGTCLVKANKLEPMASYTSDGSHGAFMCSSESL